MSTTSHDMSDIVVTTGNHRVLLPGSEIVGINCHSRAWTNLFTLTFKALDRDNPKFLLIVSKGVGCSGAPDYRTALFLSVGTSL